MSVKPETQLRRAAVKFDAARLARDEAVLAGHKAGMSLRDLADASGLGVETVRRIVMKAVAA